MTGGRKRLCGRMLADRLKHLVDQFYKILPMKETEMDTLEQYMLSLQREMIGMRSLIDALEDDGRYLSLMAILQYLIENDCDVQVVRTEVFKAIRLINALRQKYVRETERVDR